MVQLIHSGQHVVRALEANNSILFNSALVQKKIQLARVQVIE